MANDEPEIRLKRLREFKGTTTRFEYDAEFGTFGSVDEVHPSLDAEVAKAT